MSTIRIDASRTVGKMKIMHAVNNVPTGNEVRCAGSMSNYKYFEEAGIPYCRSHDAGLYDGYCGEYAVDVHRIFRNFAADENDPASYDFEYTDKYVMAAEKVGAHVFYRLGASIEHRKKVGTVPPPDFNKWARICEHIVMHYNEWWADGYHLGLEYWEIWNEPHCKNADGSNPCWQGTYEQFYELFCITFRHLKSRFPSIKVGGPALCHCRDDAFNHGFFDALKRERLVIDFFSFHGYYKNPSRYNEETEKAYALLKEYGVEDKTALHLNEWNYVRQWTGDGFVYSLHTVVNLKGASYIAGSMAVGQKSKLEMMMYYSAMPGQWNGMFDSTFLTPHKGYYPFKMFGEMYRMKNEMHTSSDDETVYVVGATDGNISALMFTYFDDDDNAPEKDITLDFSHLGGGEKTIEYYVLNEDHDDELVRTDKTSAETLKTTLKTKLYTTYFIKITK